jgi:hypothetical protein
MLESLDRDDQALVDYVNLVEDAPDSVLGRLAALHFERIDSNE